MPNSKTPILLFDGICNLCNGSIEFIIKIDPKEKLKFATLQSDPGQILLKKFALPLNHFDSFVYIREENYFLKSTAVLHVLKELGGGWKLFYALILIPRPLRDFIYDLIAKSRYSIFGKRSVCMTPSEEINQRFLS